MTTGPTPLPHGHSGSTRSVQSHFSAPELEELEDLIAAAGGGGGGGGTVIDNIADVPGLVAALNAKADDSEISSLASAIGSKADASAVTTALGSKANTADVSTALGNKQAAGQYVTAAQAGTSLWIGTQSQYDAITPKVATTIYIVKAA